jgi:hypothetical protein
VPVAFFFSDDQEVLAWRRSSLRHAEATECHKENERYNS